MATQTGYGVDLGVTVRWVWGESRASGLRVEAELGSGLSPSAGS